ncbi:MAG: hypothetical protein IPG98_04915 [Burkholderiales bacterium]|nr:hypothetical protein [Burkholderiales bacterium]
MAGFGISRTRRSIERVGGQPKPGGGPRHSCARRSNRTSARAGSTLYPQVDAGIGTQRGTG